MSDAALAAAYAHCDSLLRAGDEDRWRASLFAPEEARGALHALYAFNVEIARVGATVRDATAGEIRLQWWRDALNDEARGDAAAHPVAAALFDAIGKFRLPRQAFLDLIEARTFDLYHDPMPTLADLEGYAGETSSVLMRLASFILAQGEDPGGAESVGHAGVAYGIAGVMRALPFHAREGKIFPPMDLLEREGVFRDDIVAGRGGPGLLRALAQLGAVARRHLDRYEEARASLSRPTRVACAAVALVGPYLRAMGRPGYAPLADIVDIGPLRKMWLLWRAAR